MPLLDHFHAPLFPKHSWEAIHSGWATIIAMTLNKRVLPENYFAEEHTHSGTRLEIDVSTYEDTLSASSLRKDGATATLPVSVWTPPRPAMVMPGVFSQSFEVRVFHERGGANLVAAIELVSPGNKDRPDTRRAFAAKGISYLSQGVGVVIIDVVTDCKANLHNELVRLMKTNKDFRLPSKMSTYAVSYRSIRREEEEQIDVWPAPLTVGKKLPVVPLALAAELCVPLDLEATYAETCAGHRLR